MSKETIITKIQLAPAVLESQRMECLLMATDLLKSSGRKRFKDEFFIEMTDIANHLMCYMKTGDMDLEKFLNVQEIENIYTEVEKQ